MSAIVYLNWLLHDAVASADYTSSDVLVMNERGISKDLEGSGRGLRRECCRNVRRGTEDIHGYTRREQGAFRMEAYSVTSRYQQVDLWHMAVIPFNPYRTNVENRVSS